jgi:NTP pyrophosphatase (non-canonical NTP hydrolase)
MNLNEMQKEVAEWSLKNFGPGPAYRPLLGVCEEAGELAHAHLKQEQGIRDNPLKLEADAKDAVADIIIFLMDYCARRGWRMDEILDRVWGQVKQRKWVPSNPKTI